MSVFTAVSPGSLSMRSQSSIYATPGYKKMGQLNILEEFAVYASETHGTTISSCAVFDLEFIDTVHPLAKADVLHFGPFSASRGELIELRDYLYEDTISHPPPIGQGSICISSVTTDPTESRLRQIDKENQASWVAYSNLYSPRPVASPLIEPSVPAGKTTKCATTEDTRLPRTEQQGVDMIAKAPSPKTSWAPCHFRPHVPKTLSLGRELFSEAGRFGPIRVLVGQDTTTTLLAGAYARDRSLVAQVQTTRLEPAALAVLAQELANQLHAGGV